MPLEDFVKIPTEEIWNSEAKKATQDLHCTTMHFDDTAPMELLIGTKNRGKMIEIGEALYDLQISCIAPMDLGIHVDPEETGANFEENALLKARFYYRASKGMPTLADDSGIIVEALEHELGVHTRRWGAGPDASDEEWISYFLRRMEMEKNKRARFVCVLGYIDERGVEYTFEGTCDGEITETLEAGYLPGLPISGCFKPYFHSVVYSAMNIEQKNSTSHRGKAVMKFRDFFRSPLINPK